jgi:hypothetical protein
MPILWTSFWNDDRGFIVTAEAALLATMAVVGVTVGVHSAAKSVDAELRQVARAFRSLDQSYVHYGFASGGAATAGSAYRQEPVEDSLAELRRYENRLEREQRERKER